MMCLHGIWAAGTRMDSGAHTRFINSTANANDHENELQSLQMIVKCEMSLDRLSRAQESGGTVLRRLAW